jgi:hypothetical protein
MAVGFPVKQDYATGDVLTAANLNDFAGTVNTIPSTIGAFAAGKNKIINGDFGIWQRGTSFTGALNGIYTADRWQAAVSTSVSGLAWTVSQQTFTPGSAPVAGYEGTFFIRGDITTIGSATVPRIIQKIEDVRTLAGQTVTVSWYGRSSTSTTITNALTVVQTFGSGGSSAVTVSTVNKTYTSSFQRFTQTFVMPSISGKTIGTNSNVEIRFLLEAADGANLDIWGVQLEAGSVATAFQTATGTIQGELAACQRYLPAVVGDAYEVIGFAYNTTGSQYYLKLPTTARVKPTGITVSNVAHFNVFNTNFSGGAPTAIAFNTSSIDTASLTVTTTAGSPTLVAAQPTKLQSVNASALILFTGCEL